MDQIPVENDSNLYRDPYSNAIINKNTQAYDDYMTSYSKRQENRKKVSQLQSEVNDLKSDISEIKNLLTKLLEVKNDN